MEAKLQVLEATCRALEEKFDTVMGKNPGAIQVPMVAGSPFGATQTCDKVRWCVKRKYDPYDRKTRLLLFEFH